MGLGQAWICVAAQQCSTDAKSEIFIVEGFAVLLHCRVVTKNRVGRSMTKRIDWDQLSRRQRGQRHGTESAYDEMPPAGSWADQQRFDALKNAEKNAKLLTPRTKTLPPVKMAQRPLAQCPLCGSMVGKMKRHLRKAHGAIPGYEHKAPTTTLSNEEASLNLTVERDAPKR